EAQPTTQADVIAAARIILIMSKQVSCLPCSPAIRAGVFGDSHPGSMEQAPLNRRPDQPCCWLQPNNRVVGPLPTLQHDFAARLAAFQKRMGALEIGGIDSA